MSIETISRNRPTSASAAGAVVLAAVLAAGCASVGAPQQSTTLSSFEQLNVQADGTRTWRDASTGRPETVQVDVSAIVFAAGVSLNDEQRQTLRDELATALRLRFSEAGVHIVEAQGGSAMVRVRATITAVELANPAINALTTVLLLAPLSHGGMTVEIEALDPRTNQRVAAMAFEGKAGVQNFGSAFSPLGHAKVQADLVAQRFAALVSGRSAKARV